jgi:hypothetical protein
MQPKNTVTVALSKNVYDALAYYRNKEDTSFSQYIANMMSENYDLGWPKDVKGMDLLADILKQNEEEAF